MTALIEWDEFSPGYRGSHLMLTFMEEHPKIIVFLEFRDPDNELESEGVVTFEELMESHFHPFEAAEDQLAKAAYFRSLADRLEKAARQEDDLAFNHLNKFWMNAEPELVEEVARALCARHGAEIFGAEAVTPEFVNKRWPSFENDAREAIAIVRFNDSAFQR